MNYFFLKCKICKFKIIIKNINSIEVLQCDNCKTKYYFNTKNGSIEYVYITIISLILSFLLSGWFLYVLEFIVWLIFIIYMYKNPYRVKLKGSEIVGDIPYIQSKKIKELKRSVPFKENNEELKFKGSKFKGSDTVLKIY